jgi:magnesium-transporting ATPase (P-type)
MREQTLRSKAASQVPAFARVERGFEREIRNRLDYWVRLRKERGRERGADRRPRLQAAAPRICRLASDFNALGAPKSSTLRAVLRIGNFLILTTVGLVLLIGVAALLRHDPLLKTLQFALILTVASIPVALPAVLSVTMAVGAEKLAQIRPQPRAPTDRVI